jgi:hypothetical protein
MQSLSVCETRGCPPIEAPGETRSQLRRALTDARRSTDALFTLLTPEGLLAKLIAERHRLIFYLGHLEAFDWNLVRALWQIGVNSPATRAALWRALQLSGPLLFQFAQNIAAWSDETGGLVPVGAPLGVFERAVEREVVRDVAGTGRRMGRDEKLLAELRGPSTSARSGGASEDVVAFAHGTSSQYAHSGDHPHGAA